MSDASGTTFYLLRKLAELLECSAVFGNEDAFIHLLFSDDAHVDKDLFLDWSNAFLSSLSESCDIHQEIFPLDLDGVG